MRILYVSAEPVPGTLGGSVHTAAVATGLARRGHAVTLLTASGQGTLEGVRVLRAPMRLGGKTLPLLALPKILCLPPSGFDVVMARFSALGGGEGLFAARAGLPLVLEVNSPQVAEVIWRHGLTGPAAWGLEAWERAQFRRARFVVTPSDRIVPQEARTRCRIVQWGCDPEVFRPAAHGRGKGPFLIAFAGSFRPWHGADLLPALARMLPEARFVCAGDGDGLKGVQEECRRLGVLESFRFEGAVPQAHLAGLLGSADLGIAPFRIDSYEPFRRFGFFYSPLKLFEYMASGLPVLTTRCPELEALVREGETGFLVDEGDLDGMVQRIKGLIGDSQRRERMGREARNDAEGRFSWASHVEGLETILVEACDARRV